MWPTSPRHSRSSRPCCEAAGVKETDVVYDLGSGDGRIVITAAKKYGARGVGIELDPALVKKATENAAAAGVVGSRAVRRREHLRRRYPRGDGRDALSAPEHQRAIRPRLVRELKPGTRVVSHVFNMGPEWPPEKKLIDRPQPGLLVDHSGKAVAVTQVIHERSLRRTEIPSTPEISFRRHGRASAGNRNRRYRRDPPF